MKVKHLTAVLMLALMVMMSQAAYAENASVQPKESGHSARTILMYVCGSDLETEAGLASFNLNQILGADFSADEDVKFIVMTGGSYQWMLDDDKDSSNDNGRLVFPEDVSLPDNAVYLHDPNNPDAYGNPKSQISNVYNQVWEARGADAPTNPGRMVLLDGDGITKDTPTESKNEVMGDPGTLKAFINYGVKNYPADRYDLILWDHAGGPAGGFAADMNDEGDVGMMTLSGIIDALAHNDLTDPGDGASPQKFDFIDFDACLMNSVEMNLAMADYTDCYIASAETEPGYGQEYSGWLNLLGTAPDLDAYSLGRKAVDDFYEFYDSGYGQGQNGTLAVVDLKKLMAGGFVESLREMAGILKQQVSKGLFYDEFSSMRNSIRYGKYMNYFDLGNLASLISVANMEIEADELDKDHINTGNAYSDADITGRICRILQDENIIYARGTDGICSRDKVSRTVDGDTTVVNLYTSGMYIFFTTPDILDKTDYLLTYYEEISKVIDMMPVKDDGRSAFLSDYTDVLADYALAGSAGRAVDWLINEDHVSRDEIDYQKVRDHWTDGDESKTVTDWAWIVKDLFAMRRDGESDEAKAWLDSLVKQQAQEAVSPDNISASRVRTKDGTGYKVRIRNANARSIYSVEREVEVEIPALEKYIKDNFDSEVQRMIRNSMEFSAGSVGGRLNKDDLPENASAEEVVRWYNRNECEWDLDAPDRRWFAVKDADGRLHAAALLDETGDEYYVAGIIKAGEDNVPVVLVFRKGEDASKLTEIMFSTSEGYRPIKVSELSDSLPVSLSLMVTIREIWNKPTVYLPTSESTLTVGAAAADDISLIYTGIENISDIADTDGDGEIYHNSFVYKDIYNLETNISEIVNSTEDQLVGIDLAYVKPGIYTGNKLAPEVVYHSKTLEEGVDYTWQIYTISEEEPDPDLSQVGHYRLLLKGTGRFTGLAVRSFDIVLSEDSAYQKVYEAEQKVREAQEALEALISSEDTAGLKEAYDKLVEAQNSLAEAEEFMEETQFALDLEAHAAYEDKLSELEEQVQDLNSELIKAREIDISNYEVVMKTSFVYDADGVMPDVKVSGLDESAYRLEYNSNYWVGTAYVTIEGKSGYKGSITRYFTINPKKAVVSKVSAGKGKMTVTAKTKVSSTGGSHYQIRYKVKGTSKWKTKTTAKKSLTISKLKKGRQYQVQLRSIKKSGKKTYSGAWSKVKTSAKIK